MAGKAETLQKSPGVVSRGVKWWERREGKLQCEVGLQWSGGALPKRTDAAASPSRDSSGRLGFQQCARIGGPTNSLARGNWVQRKGGKSAGVVFCVVGEVTLVEPVLKGWLVEGPNCSALKERRRPESACT